MVKKIREYWFGIFLTSLVLVSLVFAFIVALSPHNDLKMRGFAPCTFQMADDLSKDTAKREIWSVFATITKTNLCYVKVIGKGMALWFEGKQSSPWANYMFEPLTFEAKPEESEPYSKDLLEANRFKDDDILFDTTVVKELNDETVQK